MSFIAHSSAGAECNTVLPEAVEDGVDVVFPACGATMRPRGPYEDSHARHFYHLTTDAENTTSNCSGGESDPIGR